MTTRATITASDLATLAAEDIAAQAKESAAALLSQGWDPDGSTYDLGAFSGDREALAQRLGYEPTREQCRDLERQIRAALADTTEPLTPADTAEIERKALAAANSSSH